MLTGEMLESYGKLLRGTIIPIVCYGTDWVRVRRMLVPVSMVSLPAPLGSLRAEYIAEGLIRPRKVGGRRGYVHSEM